MTKKVLACLLAMMLALSLLPGTAGAVLPNLDTGPENYKTEADENGTKWLCTEYTVEGAKTVFADHALDLMVGKNMLVDWKDPVGTYTLTYDSDGNLLSITRPKDEDFNSSNQSNYVPNKDGTLAKQSWLSRDASSGNNSELREEWDYTYNAAGNLTETTGKITLSWSDSEYMTRIVYSYDDTGNLLSEVCTSDSDRSYTTTYQYNADGSKIAETIYENGPTVVTNYDSSGRIISERGGITGDNTYQYDEHNNVVKRTNQSVDYSGNQKTTVTNYTYTYDKSGNVLKQHVDQLLYSSDYNYIIYSFDYYYTYDEYNNLVKIEIPIDEETREFYHTTDHILVTLKYEPFQVTSPSETYTITFDPNGGKVSPTTAKTGEDGKLASLPTPTRDGYSFADWYTAKTGGEKVTSAYTFTDDATVYAHWTENSGGGNGSGSSGSGGGATSYAVSTPSKTDNGSVTVSPKNAAQGKTVTITPKPDEGCKVDKVTVTDKNGNPVEVKDNGDGTYSFTMPGSKVNVTAAFVKNEPAPADNERFTDVPKDAWYHDAVYWAADNGITQGVDDTHFVPNGTCTRSEAVTFLWRAKGEPEPTTTTNPFKDVKESDYFYKAVLWAVENGITVGVKADSFAPKQTCSTAHILTFLYRTMGVGADGWYEDAGAWAEKDGLLKDTGLTANPKVNCPRGAVVTFLYREQK